MKYLLLLCLSAMSGCSASSELVPPRFDPISGNMIVAYSEAVVFARAMPHLSTSGRDYLYLGPAEVSRNGVQTYYLWVGVGSTLDRSFAGERQAPPVKLSLELDEETLDLPLDEWIDDVSQLPYPTAVPIQASLRAQVTLEDLERLAQAGLTDVTLFSEQGQPAKYGWWRGRWPESQLLARDAGMGFTVEVRRQP